MGAKKLEAMHKPRRFGKAVTQPTTILRPVLRSWCRDIEKKHITELYPLLKDQPFELVTTVMNSSASTIEEVYAEVAKYRMMNAVDRSAMR